MPQHISHAAAHAGLVVVRAEHEASQLGEHDRPGALRTGLERHEHGTVGQSIGFEGVERALHREQLGVGRRIAPAHCAHGSSVTYNVQSVRRSVRNAWNARPRASNSA